MREFWPEVGKEYNGSPADKGILAAAIDAMEWRTLPIEHAPMMHGLGIKNTIQQLKIPGVRKVSYSSTALDPYGFYGIEGFYTNGRAELFVVDDGTRIVPVLSRFYPKEEANV